MATAPSYTIPAARFVTIEYPGHVALAESSKAIETLGGHSRLASGIAIPQSSKGKSDSLPDIELHLRDPKLHPYSHPIPGDIVPTANIVLKVTKRKRKNATPHDQGIYTIDIAGIATKAVRFRGMADFQYQPPRPDPIIEIADAMRKADIGFLRKCTLPAATEDYGKDLNLIPPPVFSRINVHGFYNYKPNINSIETTRLNHKGEEYTRLVNRSAYSGVSPITISVHEKNVPTGPPAGVRVGESGADADLIERLLWLLQKRPIWSRTSLFCHLTTEQVKTIEIRKKAMALVSYAFADGAFKDLIIKFGYDPRTDPANAPYQRLGMRSMPGTRKRATFQPAKFQELAGDPDEAFESHRQKHVFDGVVTHSTINNFQLCDITDPHVQAIATHPKSLRKKFDPRDGFYRGEVTELLRRLCKEVQAFMEESGKTTTHYDSSAIMELFEESIVNAEFPEELEEEQDDDQAAVDAAAQAQALKIKRLKAVLSKKNRTKPKPKKPSEEANDG